ncbi:hypothetical protein PQX77_018766 [Marasmius sp. AFHP31]|nr:hypothetical protein PQX77_018766 [Marasmius sp. AFHP31]
MPNATEVTVYNFLRGQYTSFTKGSFKNALALYPLEDYNNSFSLQGQQMYGEARFICTASLITGAAASKSPMKAFQYHYNNDHLGSDHRAELAAFWENADAASDDDKALFKGMREFYSSFVTSGQPQSSLATWEATDVRGTRRLRFDPAGTRMEEMSTQARRCARELVTFPEGINLYQPNGFVDLSAPFVSSNLTVIEKPTAAWTSATLSI